LNGTSILRRALDLKCETIRPLQQTRARGFIQALETTKRGLERRMKYQRLWYIEKNWDSIYIVPHMMGTVQDEE
jgi:hypothetical protein